MRRFGRIPKSKPKQSLYEAELSAQEYFDSFAPPDGKSDLSVEEFCRLVDDNFSNFDGPEPDPELKRITDAFIAQLREEQNRT